MYEKVVIMYKNILVLTLIVLGLELGAYNIAYNGNNAQVSYDTSWGKERFFKDEYIKYFPYYKKWVEDYSHIDALSIDLKKLPFPYCKLPQLVAFNPFGMYFNGEYVKKLFEHNNITTAVEIGSYFGVSTRHIASLLPEDCKLYAIDSWEYYVGQYEQFLSNMVISGLAHKVTPVKQKSDTAINFFRQFNKKFDFIYVDGDHETAGVLSDLENYYPLLTPTGVICGDDWLLKTVRAAVQQFAEKHELTIYADCNFWFLKKEDCGYCYKSFLEADDSVWFFGSK
jgi:predicted O-methyltransferase YrrM